jgi:broad-specificity NMP kinase
MNYFIIIRGPAGVGKSTISKLLEKKINGKIIHYDRVMTGLKLNYIPGEKWIPLDKFLEADKIMIPKFKRKLNQGINLIFDGNFYHKEHVENLVRALDYPNFIFTLKADLDECIKRDRTRKGVLGKETTKEVFDLSFDYGTVIDTNNKTPDAVAKEIITHLSNSNNYR